MLLHIIFVLKEDTGKKKIWQILKRIKRETLCLFVHCGLCLHLNCKLYILYTKKFLL